ncbi:MAG: hypothetical protein D6738_05700 [Acidobacteria bacterium]|nr:MAG: hypothetical protein D6738_05700 [Acidobacteriota bacterium]
MRLARAGEAGAPATGDEPPATRALLELVDGFPRRALEALRTCWPGPAFVVAFVRGSLIQSRVGVIRFRWQLLRERLGLRSVERKLAREFGEERVAAVMHELERRVAAKVLRHDDPLGPSKFLVRLAVPDERLFDEVEPAEVESLVEGLARQAQDCGRVARALFREADPGGARERIRARARRLLARWLAAVPADVLDAGIELLLGAEACGTDLHPCLPIRDEAVAALARRMAIPEASARTVIRALRFAWLSVMDGPEDLSDLSLKCLAVLPAPAREDAWRVARALSDRIQETAESDPALRELHAARPAVRIGALTHVVFVPEELHRRLADRDLPDDGILLPIQHRLGGTFLEEFLGEHAALAESITQLKIKRPCFRAGEPVERDVEPLDLSPKRVRKLVRKAILDDSGEALRKCAHLFGTLGRDDYTRNLRGLWELLP